MKHVFSLEVPEAYDAVFNHTDWTDREIKSIKSGKTKYNHEHLLNLIKIEDLSDVNILDFGGSLGSAYFAIKDRAQINKHYIVEVPHVCEIGKKEFPYFKLFFTETIPDDNIDVVYCRTAIQYSVDWKETLKKLIAVEAKYIMFCHLSAGNIDTFLASQNYYDDKIPYWFINRNEINDIFNNSGYKLIIEERCSVIPEKYYDNTISSEQRLSHTLDLIYEKL